MSKRRVRRLFQSGGVIPSFQGAQVLNSPFQVQRQISPVAFNPNSGFQALQSIEQNRVNDIREQQLNLSERELKWKKDLSERENLQFDLNNIQQQRTLALDGLTNLDLNVPSQRRLSDKLHKEFDSLMTNSTNALTDQTLNPKDRMLKLHENVGGLQKLMSDPEYIESIKRNQVSDLILKDIYDSSFEDNSLLDFRTVNSNLGLVNKYQSGEISEKQMLSKLKNYKVDLDTANDVEKGMFTLMSDALENAPGNWEKYQGDADAIVFMRKINVGSLDDQAVAVRDFLKKQEVWLRKQEVDGNRSYLLGDDGLVDDEKLLEFAKDTVKFYRSQHGISDDDTEFNDEIKLVKRNNDPSTRSSEKERKIQSTVSSLGKLGYDVEIEGVIDEKDSAASIDRLLNTPDKELVDELTGEPNKELINKKRDLEKGIIVKPVISDSVNDGEFNQYGSLNAGFNDEILPDKLDKNLAIYTNNPFNIKGKDDVPVIKKYDNENDGLYHRVFRGMNEGFDAGLDLLNRYVTPSKDGLPLNRTFAQHLRDDFKTLRDATISDLYKTWATGATDENIQIIAEEAGVNPDTKLSEVDINDLAMGILKVENGEVYNYVKQNGLSIEDGKIQSSLAPPTPREDLEDDVIEEEDTLTPSQRRLQDLELERENILESSIFRSDNNKPELENIDKRIKEAQLEVENDTKIPEIREKKIKELNEDVDLFLNDLDLEISRFPFLDTNGQGKPTIEKSDTEPPQYRIRVETPGFGGGFREVGTFTKEKLNEFILNENNLLDKPKEEKKPKKVNNKVTRPPKTNDVLNKLKNNLGQ